MTFRAVAGTLSSATAGDSFRLTQPPKRSSAPGQINVAIYGAFSATARIECSFDGSNWVPMAKDPDGNYASYTTPVALVIDAPEVGVSYRINCTAYTSGTINYRFSV